MGVFSDGISYSRNMQEHESPKKKPLTRIQSIFQSLKVSKFFHIKCLFLTKIFENLVGVGEGWRRGGGGVGEG
jgi:hypothetical protein